MSPPSFSLKPNRRVHRHRPAAGDPPPCGASHHGRQSRSPSNPRSLPVASASRRAFPRPRPWPLAPFRHRRRTSGEVPARRRRRARACDHSRRSQPTAQIKRGPPPRSVHREPVDLVHGAGLRPRPPPDQGSTAQIAPSPVHAVAAGHFMKTPLSSLIFCPNPSTFKRSSHLGPVFIVLAPVYLENPTRGPEHPFYDLDLLFLSIITF
jgi:hypothetical protein